MNILITGGAGYIGSQLLLDLPEDPQLADARVVVYDNMQEERYASLMHLPPNGSYDFHYGDVRDAEELAAAAEDADVIIHLAALVNAAKSFDRDEQTERINHQGTENVVAAAVRSPRVRRVIYASTCGVYGETSGLVNEDAECNPGSPYAKYKLSGERSVLALSETTQGRVSGTALRLGTVFGMSPGLRVHTVINIFALHAGLGIPLQVYGTGEQNRPFLHVRDASSAFIFAMANESTRDEKFNVLSENDTVKNLLSYIRPRFPKLRVEHRPGTHINQISYEVDGSRYKALDWQPTLNVEAGVEEFARLYSAFSTAPDKMLVSG